MDIELTGILLLLIGLYLLYSAFYKKTVVDGEEVSKPPPLYRPLKFLLGIGLTLFAFFGIFKPLISPESYTGATGRGTTIESPVSLNTPSNFPSIQEGENLTLQELTERLGYTESYDSTDRKTVAARAAVRLTNQGIKIAVSFDGALSVRPLQKMDDSVVKKAKQDFMANNPGHYSTNPFHDLRDYRRTDNSLREVRADCRDWLSERLSVSRIPLFDENESDSSLLGVTVSFRLENHTEDGLPQILSLSEEGKYGNSTIAKLLSLQMKYTLGFQNEGRKITTTGTLIPEYERFTWRQVDAPYRLIGRLLSEQLADEILVQGAAFMKQDE